MQTAYGPRILRLRAAEWAQQCAELLVSSVARHLDRSGHCSVMLTGGRGAATLYGAWGNHPGFRAARGVDYYFGDERCVPPEDAESNFGMAMRTLFGRGVPPGCAVHRMEGEHSDNAEAAARYASSLPPQIDILLLSVGEDGHIASLFPHSSALGEQCKRVVSTIGPKPPNARLTITPPVIRDAKEVFVLSLGDAKRQVLGKLALNPDDWAAIPARLALQGNWITEDVSELEWK